MHIVTISSKRQITIPKSLLETLGLEPRKKVLIEKDGGILKLRPIKKSVVEETAGSLRKYVHPSLLGKSVEEIDREAKKLYAEHLAKKYGLVRKIKK